MVRKLSGRLPPVGVDDDGSHQPEEQDATEASASMNTITTSTLLKKRNKQRGDDASKDWTEMFYDRGINTDLPPCDTTADFIVEFVEKLIARGFSRVTDHLNGRPLIVATACSGTEAPIIFLSILSKALRKKGLNFKIVHVFSIEIEPWKQTYIRRNFPGVVILRDITEILSWTDHPEQEGLMTTAYGAKYALPASSEIDLLIAGTSCTSFSTLNSQRSTDLENDENESSRTFRAYSKLVEYLKPKVAINENVSTGPFKAMMNMLNSHGCLTSCASFDSKHFGIPQTRQRGYLIAVNKSSLEQAGNLEEYSDWKTKFATMKTTFGRDASTSIEQWMEKSDSKVLRAQIELQGDVRALAVWSTCQSRHEDYRHGQRLGTGKPITDWRSTGVFRHPDHWIRDMKGFVERVHDYTDVSHLRGVVRGYDDRYISRNNDLSQNVYVQHDNTKGGIMSCLTPHGAMFNTTRGSKITGDEALRLQGIDTASLDLDGLTQAELRNFAGNAMTTTVVGAVTAFALLTFSQLFDRGNDADISVEDATTMTFRDEETVLYSCEDMAVVQQPLTVGECVHLVESSGKFCYCEAQTEVSRSMIVKCRLCNHVSCSSCGVKPRHAYEPLSLYIGRKRAIGVIPRIYPSSVEFNIAERMPMTVDLSKLFRSDNRMVTFIQQLDIGDIDHAQWAALRMPLLNCLQSIVKFQKPVRSFSWDLSWLSDSAKLELALSDTKVEAFLYALPDHKLPVNSNLRKYLAKFPVARTIPLYATTDSDKSIFDCTWQVWLPKVQVVKAIVTCGGHLIPSYQNSVGIPDYKKDFVWSEMTIEIPESQESLTQRVCGVYTARPECQQAFNSMHTKDDTIGSDQPLFLFFDHEASTGDWFKHGFIITDDPERKEWGVYRRVIARLDCSWEKPVARKLNDSYEFRDSIYDDITSLQRAMSEVINLTFFGSWIRPQNITNPMASILLDDYSPVSYQKLDTSSTQLLKETNCEVSLAAFSCKALTDATPRHWQTDCWTKVTRQNGTDFYRDCYHLLARGLVEHDVIEGEVPWIPGAEQVNIGSRCHVCAPKKPTMLWYLKQIGAKRQQAPMEDPEQAADFERLMKAAPAGMEEWVKFTKVKDHYKFEYRCLINPSALGHKAAYLLDTFLRPDIPVILSWRFIRGASGNSISPLPVSFVYSSTKDLPMSDPPRRFRADKRLRNEQRKTLTWMVNQERYPPTFMEREVVETRQENLAFRLEGRACRMVKHRAGLLAAAVGYGKTVMTFALMSKQYLVDREWADLPNLDGLIHTKATLSLVPAHLTLQWKGEACAFLGYEMKDDPRLLVLTTCLQIKALTVQKIRDAELVICSSSQLGSEGYLKIVAKNAGVVDLARSSSDRAKEAWLINANEQRRDNLLYLQRNLPMAHDENNVEARKQEIDKFTEFMKEKYKKSFADSGANKPHMPSRRLKGAALTKDLEKKNNGGKGNKGKAKTSTDEDDAEVSFAGPEFELDCVLGLSSVSLQDFAWARVVTDEISYNVANFIAVAIRELVAQSRWALSATPNITDHLSASRIARCLGINLGSDDQETVRKDKHLTSAERFLSYGPDASPSWHAARLQVAQEFCDMFVRQDKRPDTGRFNRVHCFVGMQMATPQLACYLTIKSDVTNKGYMMTRTTDTRSAVQEELQRTYGRELDGRLRLTKAASFFPEHSRKTIPYTLKTCKDLRAIALGEISVAKDHIRRQIELIRFLLPLPQVVQDPDMATRYNNWRAQILAHHRYPDPDALQDLAQVIAAVEIAPLKEQHELYFTVPQAPLGRRLYPAVEIMLNGRKMDGLLADCRRVLTELHKTAMALVHTRQEYRYFRAVVDIDQAGQSSPRGTLACNCCNLQSPLSEVVIQGNCGHILCTPCDNLLEDGLCPVELCGGTSLHNQKYTAMSLYSPAGNFDSDNAVEISQTKAELSAIRKIFWEHDDAFNKFLVFSPLPEYLALAEAVIAADGIPCVNLKGRKSDIARVLENFKNNRGMNYKEGPTRKRAPSKKTTAAAPAAPAQGPPVVKVTPPSEDSKKRKRDDSEDDTQNAPLPKSARVASPRQLQNDSDGPPDVSDSEGGTIRTSNLKRKRGSGVPDDLISQNLKPAMIAENSEELNGQFSAQHSDGMVVELPEVPVLMDSANSDDYTRSGGLGFAEDGGSEDDDSADDNSKDNLVRDPVPMKPPTSAAPLAHNLPGLPSPFFVESPPVVYPPIHPSETEVTDGIGDNAPMASAGANHPDDTPVDWDRLGLEAEYEEYEEDLDPTARVLFLDITDESAAGSNLTVVQHVIFMTPYYAEKTRYNAAMTQAIGRAIRQGQEKGATVMIHHLLVKDTVEMDIAHELMDDDFPGKANAMPMLTKFKSDIGPAFFRK
ncbi:hypothetical protein EYC80_006821 [Monilinia laxa]|uniref:Uncharacterized protein n=1 Tax=Monilinia laxa TaxID=61186 RepID=A0A5N6JZB1_MONLA|nr:hypothetical protein EYC80_006821 [Monilinia laxa]